MDNCHPMEWRVFQSAHLHHQQIMTRELCTKLNTGWKNNGGIIGIPQILCQVGTMNTHKGTERALQASSSGPAEPIQDWRWITSLEETRRQAGVEKAAAPLKKIFKTHPSVSKVMCNIFWDKRWSMWFFCDLYKPLILTATSEHWLSWRLKFPKSGWRRR